jgi:thiamine pyrophosphate-dependent acetolactate synthase large subunit-like protein
MTMQQATNSPVYEWIAHDLQAAGVEAVFGLMSDDTAALVATIDSLGLSFHGARHEASAVAMAEGYASASGRLGIAIVGRGPATANALNGALYAERSGARVLLIVGATPTARPAPNGLGPDGKRFDADAVFKAAGLRTFTVTHAGSARVTLAAALASAQEGLTVLQLPTDVQRACPPVVEPPPAPRRPAPRQRPTPGALQAAAALLAASRKPLIICGLGAHEAGAREAVERLAERVGAVVATTLKAKDMFRGYAFNGGLIGSFSHAGGRRLFDQADCVIALGAGLNQRTTSFGHALPARAPVIQVDRDRSHIGRWWTADVAMVADVVPALEDLLAALTERAPADKPLHTEANREALAHFDMASEFQPAHTARTVDPRVLTMELDTLLPAQRNAVYDAGNFYQVVPYFGVPGPSHFKSTIDNSSVGMGIGTALGFACARRDETTVLFIGDGGLLMTLGELETGAREDLPLVVVVMNDCAYGAEMHFLKERSMPVAKSQFLDIDFAPVAAAFGYQSFTIRNLKDLRAIGDTLRNPQGPVFLDCKINGAIAATFVLEALEQERRHA